MARSYAQVGTNLWTEPTIRSLTRDQQRAYLLVLTQPELSRCGVLPYRLKRLAALANDDNPAALRKNLRGLAKTKHLVIDENAEEILVRTYVRHDGLLAQPQIVATMVDDYSLIESPTIRAAFLSELRRIWDLDLPTNQRLGLALAFGDHSHTGGRFQAKIGLGLGPDLTAAFEAGSLPPFDPASQAGCPAPWSQAEGQPLAGARPRSPISDLPSPTPAPSAASGADVVTLPRHGRHTAPTAPTDPALTHPTQVIHLLEQTGPYVPAVKGQLATEIDQLLTAGIPTDAITRALGVWRTRKAGPGLLPHLVQDELTPSQLQDPRFAGLLADAAASTTTRSHR